MSVQWPLLIFSILIGISAGMMIFVAIGELQGKYKELRFNAAVVAFVLVAVGGCVSALHLGHPERALHILGNYTSGLSRELFAVGGFAVATFVYAILVKKDFAKQAKIFAIIAMVLGLILPFIAGASYVMPSRPTWNSLTLPLMYLGTGLGTGFLVMAALACKKCSQEEADYAKKIAFIAVLVAVVSMLAYVAWMAMAPLTSADSDIVRCLSGDLALWFWLGTIVLGVIAPVALAFVAYKADDLNKAATMLWASFACSIIGGIALRVIMYLMAASVEEFFY